MASKTNNYRQRETYFMFDIVPLPLRDAMQVHIVSSVLHYEPLQFPDTLQLQFNTTHHQQLWRKLSHHTTTHEHTHQTPTVLIAALVNGDFGDGFRMMKDDMSAASWACTAAQRSVTNWGSLGFRPYAEG
jgi:hypothetical protein